MKAQLNNLYLFRDKDPVIDYLRTAKQKVKMKDGAVAKTGGVAYGTVHNMFGGKTRNPQFATVMRIARAIGPGGIAAVERCIKSGGKK